MTLTIHNPIPEAGRNPKTYLSSAIDVAKTILPVSSVDGFFQDRYIQLGETGNNNTEILFSSAVGSDDFTASTGASYGHAAGTPVYEIRYNQVRIYRTRASVESTLVTLNLVVSDKTTIYADTAYQSGDTYKFAFLNSYSGDITPKSNAQSASYPRNALYRMREMAKTRFKGSDRRYNDDDWNDFLNESYSELYLAAIDQDENYNLTGPLTLTSPTELANSEGSEFSLNSTTRIIKWLYFSYDGSEYVWGSSQDMRRYNPNESFDQANPVYSFTGSTIIVRPGNCSTIKYYHYPKLTDLAEDDDTPISPIDSYPELIVLGALKRAYGADKNSEWKNEYRADYDHGMQRFLAEIDRRNVMEDRHVEITDTRHNETYFS